MSSHAQNQVVEVLLSSNAPHYHLVYRTLTQRLSTLSPDVDLRLISSASGSQPTRSLRDKNQTLAALRVTIGTDAYENALRSDPVTPVIALFLPRKTYESLTEQFQPVRSSAIYLDQPLTRQFKLISLMLPNAKNIAVAVGSISRLQVPELKEEALKEGFTLEIAELNQQTNPIHALSPIIKDSDVFLAVPDQATMNRIVAKWVLQLGYRLQVPVIGFSRSYTDAGALAAIYTTPENTGNYAAELVSAWLKDENDEIWQPGYTRYFTINTNPAVARSLRLVLPDTHKLYTLIEQSEGVAP